MVLPSPLVNWVHHFNMLKKKHFTFQFVGNFILAIRSQFFFFGLKCICSTTYQLNVTPTIDKHFQKDLIKHMVDASIESAANRKPPTPCLQCCSLCPSSKKAWKFCCLGKRVNRALKLTGSAPKVSGHSHF